MATRINRANAKATAPKPKKRKRGIVLLVVISLLALFILMGVAYVIVAMNYKQAAEAQRLVEQVGDPPQREMELVLDQILFDTLGRSSLRGQSVLGDLYGGDSVGGALTANATALDSPTPYVAGANQQPQVWQFTAIAPPLPNPQFHQSPGYYSGRVLTFLSGNAAGHSTRILEFAYLGGVYGFAVEAIESKGPLNLEPNGGSLFLINGAPFNGVGAGYNVASGTMGATYAGSDGAGGYLTPNLVALLPHFSGYDASAGSMSDALDAGGLDETWDAVDFQNMFLAMVPPISAGAAGTPIIPSYHRPELINYWRNHLPSEFSATPLDAFPLNDPATASQIRNWLRTFIFRPMPWEHPNFNGSNPAFDSAGIRAKHIALGVTEPVLSQTVTNELLDNLVNFGSLPLWDVDNDNDGVPESIWIDPGLPVITRPDGRRYKRLVAICVKDLDGRINLNAHGNLAQGNTDYRAENTLTASVGLAGVGATLPRGMGFGPAEVQFLHVFTNGGTASYGALLLGRYASNLGADSFPGIPGTRDPLSFVKHHGIPDNYATVTPPFYSLYASPPDVWGRGAIALDYGGQPFTRYMGLSGEITDAPYEMSLSGQPNNADSPYTLVELERMLRYHDQDTLGYASRPLALATSDLASESPGVVLSPPSSHDKRELFTVHSSHLSIPAYHIPQEMRSTPYFAGEPYTDSNSNGRWDTGEPYTDSNSNGSYDPPKTSTTILDVYRSRLMTAGITTEPALSNELRKIVPWELMHGQRFDLNRWLGDGFDSNGDFTPDDYAEAFAGESAWQACASFTGVAAQHSNGMDVNSDGFVTPVDRFLARQLYARHLYGLAMLMIPGSLQAVPGSFDPPCPQEPGLTLAQRRELAIRRIAQWAINCVDARDADSIMTAYEYDINPWDGWQVDGNPATDGSAMNQEMIDGSPLTTSQRRLVWGMEYPDLLITETLATHDRGVKDTNQDTTGQDRNDTPTNDDDVDQFRVPQGSLFIELYCPRNTVSRNPLLPRELYDVSVPANPRLQLAKMDGAGTRPVWRMAISRLIEGDATQRLVHPADMATTNPESASYDPFVVNLLPAGTPATPVAIERFAYFGDASGLPAAELAYSFYNSVSNPLVEPGQYVVVGPRAMTFLGSQNPASAIPAAAPGSLWGGNSRQYIELNGTGITIYDTENPANQTTLTPGTDIRPAVPVICDMPGVTPNSSGAPWAMACPWNIGLNITEPLPSGNYYPQPMLTVTPAGATNANFYDDPEMPTPAFLDTPVESPGSALNAGRPVADRGMTESGPYYHCSSVFLQRLANPNVGFDPALNPYITVDWATIDVNMFSGEEDSDRTVMGGPNDGDPIDMDDQPANQPNGGLPIGTRQRGYMPTPPVADANYWNPVVSATPGDLTAAASPAGSYFIYNLSSAATGGAARHTFGYVNDLVGTPIGPAPNTYLGEPSLTATGQTCPWLTWHNRPFASPMELFAVPSSAAGRVCSEITPGPLQGSGNVLYPADDIYDATDAADGPMTFRSPFGTLLNFFQTADQGASPTAAAQLVRLLDYVEVPSPYLGAERWYNPAHLAGPFVPPTNPLATYRPPFNKMSRFRDPGRININTIFDARIWDAAAAQFPGLLDADGMWPQVAMSRQGHGAALFPLPPGDYPTWFANPFRSADASDMMPDPPGPGNMQKDRPVDATLLRPAPTVGDAAVYPDPPQPLFAMTSTLGHNNTDRNPYFRYQGFQKLGSVFSTHSNVFAVWMTVGYFEVEPISTYGYPPNPAHPEGWVLGQEIGADSGEVTRHRSFYIIDRSVPVGFQPGQKHNTDDCILLRRFIE